jgi:hypothetical protein
MAGETPRRKNQISAVIYTLSVFKLIGEYFDRFTMKIYLMLLLGLVWASPSMGLEVPFRSDGGSISYATKDLYRRRGEFMPPQLSSEVEELNQILFNDLSLQGQDLKRVKFYLVNGDVKTARAILTKLTYTQTKLRPVVYRYLAILSFLDSDFKNTLEYLNFTGFNSPEVFGKICLQKTLALIALNKIKDLEDTWGRCRNEISSDSRPEGLLWIDSLVALKLNPNPGITKVPFRKIKLSFLDLEELKTMMKLALYLNQEDMLITQLTEFDLRQLSDPEVREIAGQALFRKGHFAKAYRFIEDIKTPNTENIKGNLYTLRKKYELAYAQFKLALGEKENSQNALERLLPMSWLLGDWNAGAEYANRIIASPKLQMNKLILMALFNLQKGDYEMAEEILERISQSSRRGRDLEVTQLGSFIALMQNQPESAQKNATLSCEQNDLVNCWVLFQLSQWDNFALTIRREEKLQDKREWEKLINEDIDRPLKETVYINQLDIEELDDKLIQIVPKN